MAKSDRSRLYLAALLTLLTALAGLCMGSAKLNPAQVLRGLLRVDARAVETHIVWVVRLPHVAACLLAGAGLAMSGVLLQTATGNPLAAPGVIGVNAGAGFSMLLCMCLFPMAYRFFPLAAFAGAFVCTLLIVWLAGKAGGSRITIVLSGVAVSALLNAAIALLRLVDPDAAVEYNTFSAGGVSGVAFADLGLPALILLVVFGIAWIMSTRLNLLCLGDAIAQTLGVRAKRIRMAALVLASASAAAAVSFAGLMGFVGLMVPHIARKLIHGSDVKKLLPLSVLLGASLVTAADLLGRVLFAPSEVPAGIITAMIGAPFFFILLMQRRNRL